MTKTVTDLDSIFSKTPDSKCAALLSSSALSTSQMLQLPRGAQSMVKLSAAWRPLNFGQDRHGYGDRPGYLATNHMPNLGAHFMGISTIHAKTADFWQTRGRSNQVFREWLLVLASASMIAYEDHQAISIVTTSPCRDHQSLCLNEPPSTHDSPLDLFISVASLEHHPWNKKAKFLL